MKKCLVLVWSLGIQFVVCSATWTSRTPWKKKRMKKRELSNGKSLFVLVWVLCVCLLYVNWIIWSMTCISPFRWGAQPWSSERVKFDLCSENGLPWSCAVAAEPSPGKLGFAGICQPLLLREAFLNPRESPPLKFWSKQRGGIISTSFLSIFSDWTRKYHSAAALLTAPSSPAQPPPEPALLLGEAEQQFQAGKEL